MQTQMGDWIQSRFLQFVSSDTCLKFSTKQNHWPTEPYVGAEIQTYASENEIGAVKRKKVSQRQPFVMKYF